MRLKFRKISTISILIVSLLILSGCDFLEKNNAANENSLNIITSFYPMYIATANVIDGIDNVNLECLASPEVGCLHDYQLTVKDMMKLENADVFVINGGGMEAFLDKAISVYPDLKIINASESLIYEDENEEKKEIDNEARGSHNHEHIHGSTNPHLWVSVDLHINQIEEITKKLSTLDEKNKEKYETNAKAYISKLENLSEKMHDEIEILPNKNIITFHEAFHYFAEEFDLNVMAVIEREPGTSPSAKDVAAIIDTVRECDVNAIFVEPQYLKTAANTISNETNVKVYELDPATSGVFEKDAYIKIMEKNLEVLKEALK